MCMNQRNKTVKLEGSMCMCDYHTSRLGLFVLALPAEQLTSSRSRKKYSRERTVKWKHPVKLHTVPGSVSGRPVASTELHPMLTLSAITVAWEKYVHKSLSFMTDWN